MALQIKDILHSGSLNGLDNVDISISFAKLWIIKIMHAYESGFALGNL